MTAKVTYSSYHTQFKIHVSYFYIHFFILHGYITNSQYDQLPVDLIAQYRHRRGHGFESRSSLNFLFQAFFSQLLSCIHNWDGHSLVLSFIHSSNVCISCFPTLQSTYLVALNLWHSFSTRLSDWRSFWINDNKYL